MTTERSVVMVAGLALAASGALILPGEPSPSLGECVALSPPFVTGALVAALAASSRPAWRRRWIGAIDLVMLLATIGLGLLGLLMMLVPGLIVLALANGYAQIARRGDTEERSARTALALGGVWTFVFGFAHLASDEPAVLLALAASLGVGFGGLGWLRAIRRERADGAWPPRAVVN